MYDIIDVRIGQSSCQRPFSSRKHPILLFFLHDLSVISRKRPNFHGPVIKAHAFQKRLKAALLFFCLPLEVDRLSLLIYPMNTNTDPSICDDP